MLNALETERAAGVGTALLRVVVGTVFAVHGAQKVFVYGLDGVAGAFGEMGVPLAAVAGPLVAFVELLGGLALIAGLATRWVALPLAFTMLVAMLLVHLPAGFFAPNGIEFTLTLFAASVSLVLTGPGAFSLDGLIAGRGPQPSAIPAVHEARSRRAA
jgi:putative oxidoreductase